MRVFARRPPSPRRWSSIWLLLSAVPQLGRRCPPIIGALLVGALATIVLGRFDASAPLQFELIRPVLQQPAWSPAAMVELVVPLAITVLVVQNGQGFAVLKAAGHDPPVNAVTIACGIGAALSAAVGGISTCLTGPTNAIIVGSGERDGTISPASSSACSRSCSACWRRPSRGCCSTRQSPSSRRWPAWRCCACCRPPSSPRSRSASRSARWWPFWSPSPTCRLQHRRRVLGTGRRPHHFRPAGADRFCSGGEILVRSRLCRIRSSS